LSRVQGVAGRRVDARDAPDAPCLHQRSAGRLPFTKTPDLILQALYALAERRRVGVERQPLHVATPEKISFRGSRPRRAHD
jgi:hypothetical protein